MKLMLDHIVLNMEQEEQMIRFYCNVLDLEPERLDDYKSGKVAFPSVRINENTIIDLFPKKMWELDDKSRSGLENLNHFCLVMEKTDWELLISNLENHEVAILDGPDERWGARGIGFSFYFADPDGNIIEARYYE